MIVHRMGDDAVLVELDDGTQARALLAECRRRRDAGLLDAVDLVPGARTVLLDGVDAASVAAAVTSWEVPPLGDDAGPLVTIPVVFDGPDLAEVAGHWGVAPEEVPEIVVAAELTVAFCGFAPGFAYLAGLGRDVPRRAQPRTAVPARSVALAGEYAGVYPGRSPGGWQIVGTAVAVELWDPSREPAALLSAGARVRFVLA